MKIFFVINQDLFDGSAHALYCYRNCWWLASTAPHGCSVELIFPGEDHWRVGAYSQLASEHFRLGDSPLNVTALPAWRKKKQARGLTLNGWFSFYARRYLRAHAKNGDVFLTASFPKLLCGVAGSRALRKRLRVFYEVHQLAALDFGAGSSKDAAEKRALALAQRFVTTTEALAALLKEAFPATPCVNLGLASDAATVGIPPVPDAAESFTFGYLGSVYRGQGVDWLVKEWEGIRTQLGAKARLLIAGGSEVEVAALRNIAAQSGGVGVEFTGKIKQAEIPAFLGRVNALVIPSMDEGRMPFVAITKAYDYLAYERPVIAADIPSITEVMRPGVEALAFSPRDATGLVDTMRCIMSDAELRRRLVIASTERAAFFEWPSRAAKYWLYLQVGS